MSSVRAVVSVIGQDQKGVVAQFATYLAERGIILTGGGSQLMHLDKCLREVTGLPVSYAEEPVTSVVRGVGKLVQDQELLKRIALD